MTLWNLIFVFTCQVPLLLKHSDLFFFWVQAMKRKTNVANPNLLHEFNSRPFYSIIIQTLCKIIPLTSFLHKIISNTLSYKAYKSSPWQKCLLYKKKTKASLRVLQKTYFTTQWSLFAFKGTFLLHFSSINFTARLFNHFIITFIWSATLHVITLTPNLLFSAWL